MSNSLQPHGLQHSRLPCPSLCPEVCSNSCPLSQWCHATISSSAALFSFCPQSFPASRSFPVRQLFTSDGSIIGTSASVLPMYIQSWFPVGLTDLPCFPRESQESSPALQLESINSLALLLLYGSTLISIHGYLKKHSFDEMELGWQSDLLLSNMLSRFAIVFLLRSKCLLILWL